MKNRVPCKYTWTAIPFDEWVKKEAENARRLGVKLSTAGVTKLLMDRVIVPNKLSVIPKQISNPKRIRIKKNELRII